MPGIRRHHPIWTPGWPWWDTFIPWMVHERQRAGKIPGNVAILDAKLCHFCVYCRSKHDQSLRLLRTAMAMLLDHRQWKGRLSWKWCHWTKGEGAWKLCWIHGYPPLMVLQILFMYIHIHLFAWKKLRSRPSDKAWNEWTKILSISYIQA